MTSLTPVASTWTADNGNGTFTNPLFYDEFSDPDIIRVGDDFYLTGTTMHVMPGLPVLHSKDLVNWQLAGYACDRLDLGPEYRLEGAETIYGQGIWAPCFRHHNGTFYIFTNVNGRTTQLFRSTNPEGPWRHMQMKCTLHDLSVLFDDAGRVYVVWGYQAIHLALLNKNLDDVIPGSERIIIPASAGMGEGCHFYKIDGKYYIFSAWYAGRMRMPCARAELPEGPYEVNLEVSADEGFGMPEGNRLAVDGSITRPAIDPANFGRMALHQGGIVSTPAGKWWGFSMMDYNSVGRLTCLSPVTWKEGWPYFGLPGNLGRTPRTWVKPATDYIEEPSAPYLRSDSFDSPRLAGIWQWNHVPLDHKWSTIERPGYLRLHSLPAPDFWHARNTLTQRAVGPESIPSVRLSTGGLQEGDTAGLALLNYPYAWIGVRRTDTEFQLEQFDQRTGATFCCPIAEGDVWLRAHCDFLAEIAVFSYSTDGYTFQPVGEEITLIFQLRTFQGVRYALFNYNTLGVQGGCADFSSFEVEEPRPTGLTRPIPYGRIITLQNIDDGAVLTACPAGLWAVQAASNELATQFRVLDRGLGRISLQSVVDARVITVVGNGADEQVILEPERRDDSQTFQWTEMPRGDLLLLSLASHRHLRLCTNGPIYANEPGATPDRKNGASFHWNEVTAQQ